MDSYIQARLERAEMYLNQALAASKGIIKPMPDQEPDHLIRAGLKASLEQFKKIEKYIHQCGAQAAEDSKYISIIE